MYLLEDLTTARNILNSFPTILVKIKKQQEMSILNVHILTNHPKNKVLFKIKEFLHNITFY